MNKKFSTLMMGGMLLAVPSLVSAQSSFKLNDKVLKLESFQTGATGTNSVDNVIIIRDVDKDNKISKDDQILVAEMNQMGEITYKGIQFTADGNDYVVSRTDEEEAKWTLTEISGNIPNVKAWFYGLKNNNTGKYLTVDYSNSSLCGC